MSLLTNLVSYWKLDGNSNDSHGSSNGTDTAITYSNANGIINNGAGFNGTSSKIEVGAITFGTTGTISFWIYGHATSEGDFYLDSTGSRLYLWNGGGAGILTGLYMNFGAADTGWVAMGLTPAAWNYVTITWDGTNARFYKNAGLIGSAIAFAPTAITTTISKFSTRLNDTAFNEAPLDEIGFWSRALTAGEITSLYNSGAGFAYPFSSFQASPMMHMMGTVGGIM